MIKEEQKRLITNDLKKELITFHFHKFLNQLDFSSTKTHTITRVNNAIMDGVNTSLELYSPNIESSINFIENDIGVYIELINKSIENNDIIFAQDDQNNLLCFIGTTSSDEKNTLRGYSATRIPTPDFSNPKTIRDLQHSFFNGITPVFGGNHLKNDYVSILSKLHNENTLAKLLTTITPSNFNTKIREHSAYSCLSFYGYNLNSLVLSVLGYSLDRCEFSHIKNFLLKPKMIEYFKKITPNYKPPVLSSAYNLISTYFINNFTEENLNNLLFSNTALNLTKTMQSTSMEQQIKDRYFTLLDNVILNYNVDESDVNIKDFKLFQFLVKCDLEHKEFQDKFIKKYSKYSQPEIIEIIKTLGLDKVEIKSFAKKFSALSFDKNNQNYVFNSIKETNIYGVSLSRKEFLLPIKYLSWSDTKNILHKAKHQDFFFDFKDDNLTLGLYSNYSFEFNRNDFVKVIIDTILDLCDAEIKNPQNVNREPKYLNYSNIDPANIKEAFEQTIRSFMLNSVTESIKPSTETRARKKL